MELLTVPLYRLIEQGKVNRKQFEKRVGRWSAKVDKLEVQAASEVKGLLADLDKDIRSEITSFADNDSLDRSDINKAVIMPWTSSRLREGLSCRRPDRRLSM